MHVRQKAFLWGFALSVISVLPPIIANGIFLCTRGWDACTQLPSGCSDNAAHSISCILNYCGWAGFIASLMALASSLLIFILPQKPNGHFRKNIAVPIWLVVCVPIMVIAVGHTGFMTMDQGLNYHNEVTLWGIISIFGVPPIIRYYLFYHSCRLQGDAHV